MTARARLTLIAAFVIGTAVGSGGFLLLRTPTIHRVIELQASPDAAASSNAGQRAANRASQHHHGHPASRAGPAPTLSHADFVQLQARLGARIGIAIAPLGQGSTQILGDLPTGHAWSAIKVPILVTLLRERGGPGGLSPQEATWARLALTQSDNQAALGLFGSLERSHGGLTGASEDVQQTLRRAGDMQTAVNTAPAPSGFSTFGQTLWSAAASTDFYRALARGCLLPAAGTQYVLGLMSEVVGDQRWGMGSVDLNAPLAFKGGWGPENGGPYLVRQTAIVGSGNRGYVVSILAQATSAGDSFAAGTADVTDVARWISERVDPGLRGPSPSCE